MLSPPPGTIIPSGTATFAWQMGPNVTQTALSVGSSPGASDIYAGSAQTGTSAPVSVPATATMAYATLSSLTASGWVAQSYTYTVSSQPGTQPLQFNGTQATARVPANGQEVLYGYTFASGDARTITGVRASGVPLSGLRVASATEKSVVVGYTAAAGAASQSGTMSLDSPGGTVTVGVLTDTGGSTFAIVGLSPANLAPGIPVTVWVQGLSSFDPGEADHLTVALCIQTSTGCQAVTQSAPTGSTAQALQPPWDTVPDPDEYPNGWCLVVSDADYYLSNGSPITTSPWCWVPDTAAAGVLRPPKGTVSFSTPPAVGVGNDWLTITGTGFGTRGFVEACPADDGSAPCVGTQPGQYGVNGIQVVLNVASLVAGIPYCVQVTAQYSLLAGVPTVTSLCMGAFVVLPPGTALPPPVISGITFATPPGVGVGSYQLTISGSNFGSVAGTALVCPEDPDTTDPCVPTIPITWTVDVIAVLLDITRLVPGVQYCASAKTQFVGVAPSVAFCPQDLVVGLTKPSVRIMQGTTVASGRAANNPVQLSVGQQAQLTAVPANIPAGVQVTGQTNWTWTVQGTTVKNYQQTLDYGAKTSSGVVTNQSASDLSGAGPTATPSLAYYWIDGDDGSHNVPGCTNVNGSMVACQVTYTATLNLSDGTNPTVSATAGFWPQRPTATLGGVPSSGTPVINTSDNVFRDAYGNPATALEFGYQTDGAQMPPLAGITFNMSEAAPGFGGQSALVQLVDTARTLAATSSEQDKVSHGFVLDDTGQASDSGFPYYNGQSGLVTLASSKSAVWSSVDSPAVSLGGAASVNVNDTFKTYLMYRPPGGTSIWVTLYELGWSWQASAAASIPNPKAADWVIAPAPATQYSPSPPGATATRSVELPRWTNYVNNIPYTQVQK